MAGTGANIWRDDSPWLLNVYMVCNLLVALTVRPSFITGWMWLMVALIMQA